MVTAFRKLRLSVLSISVLILMGIGAAPAYAVSETEIMLAEKPIVFPIPDGYCIADQTTEPGKVYAEIQRDLQAQTGGKFLFFYYDCDERDSFRESYGLKRFGMYTTLASETDPGVAARLPAWNKTLVVESIAAELPRIDTGEIDREAQDALREAQIDTINVDTHLVSMGLLEKTENAAYVGEIQQIEEENRTVLQAGVWYATYVDEFIIYGYLFDEFEDRAQINSLLATQQAMVARLLEANNPAPPDDQDAGAGQPGGSAGFLAPQTGLSDSFDPTRAILLITGLIAAGLALIIFLRYRKRERKRS